MESKMAIGGILKNDAIAEPLVEQVSAADLELNPRNSNARDAIRNLESKDP